MKFGFKYVAGYFCFSYSEDGGISVYCPRKKDINIKAYKVFLEVLEENYRFLQNRIEANFCNGSYNDFSKEKQKLYLKAHKFLTNYIKRNKIK